MGKTKSTFSECHIEELEDREAVVGRRAELLLRDRLDLLRHEAALERNLADVHIGVDLLVRKRRHDGDAMTSRRQLSGDRHERDLHRLGDERHVEQNFATADETKTEQNYQNFYFKFHF